METWAEMYLRVGARLTQAAADHAGGCVVVVAHGGTVGASFISLGGLPIPYGAALSRGTHNASITEWVRDGVAWRLGRYNDTAHLGRLERHA
jgi:broad specificity phosphatase PhoE